MVFYAILGFACIGSLGLIVGYGVKPLAGILFIIATCVQRWNFAVMYVDDGIMHLLLFWLILLPVGKTLLLSEWLNEGKSCLLRWCHTKVPGVVVSCLIGNICWIYFFAGVTKLTSPLWREGLAFYAILLVPISRMPDFWRPEHLPLLKFVNYAALIVEITLPFFLLSPKGSLWKWVGLVFQILFNLGIVLTFKIPFANFALLASPVLFFREELMEVISRRCGRCDLGQSSKIQVSFILAIVLVVLVCMSTWRRVPVLKNAGLPVTKALWTIGIAQDYRLFDWIDRMNYHVDQEFIFYPLGGITPERVDPNTVIPRTVRHSLVQARIYDIYWLLPIPDRLKGELERDTRSRIKNHVCRRIKRDGRVVIKTVIHRVTSDNIGLTKRPRIDIMGFWCLKGKPVR
jgi:hypothetical protein